MRKERALVHALRFVTLAAATLSGCGRGAPARVAKSHAALSGSGCVPGQPDPNAGGFQLTDIPVQGDGDAAVAVQSDGKILLAGSTITSSSSAPYPFFVRRFASDGSIDTSYGSGGTVRIGIGPGSVPNQLRDMVLDGNGRAVVLVEASPGAVPNVGTDYGREIGLARLNADGTLDTTFNASGAAPGVPGTGIYWDRFGGGVEPQALLVQKDGKIVVVGQALASADGWPRAFVLRLDADGSYDAGFGDHGRVEARDPTDAGTNSGMAVFNAVAQQADGKLVAVGGGNGGYSSVVAARFVTTGALDGSFDGDGWVRVQFHGDGYMGNVPSMATHVEIESDGKIRIWGYDHVFTYWNTNGAVTQLATDGSLDTGFGNSGYVQLPTHAAAHTGLTLPSGAIWAGGGLNQDDWGYHEILGSWRYTAAGALDDTYQFSTSTPGVAQVPLLTAEGYTRGAAFHAALDDVFVAGGIYTVNGPNYQSGWFYALAPICMQAKGASGPYCGDHQCNNGESCSSCPQDCGACGPVCGNGVCESNECTTCPSDCSASQCGPVCGDKICSPGESCASCPSDCWQSCQVPTPPPAPAGSFSAVGFTTGPAQYSNLHAFAVARYTTDGKYDPTAGLQSFPNDPWGLYDRQGYAGDVPRGQAYAWTQHLPGDKLLAVGDDANGDLLQARYDHDLWTPVMGLAGDRQSSTLDPSYHAPNGFAAAGTSGGELDSAVYIKERGEVVAAGSVGGRYLLRFTRYDDNSGAPVPRFANGIVDVGASSAGPLVIKRTATKLYVAGTTPPSGDFMSGNLFFVARFNLDGTPDAAFPTVRTIVGRPSPDARVAALVVADESSDASRLYVVGQAADQNGAVDMAVLALASDGTRVTSYGSNGVALVSAGNGAFAHAAALAPDGKLVLAGAWRDPDSDVLGPLGQQFAAARLDGAGALDPGFGSGGVATLGRVGTQESDAFAVLVDSDGSVILGGKSRDFSYVLGTFTVTRLDAAGKLESTFGNGGFAFTEFGMGDAEIRDLEWAPVGSSDGCGDGTCSAGETCAGCPADCGICPPPQVCGDHQCEPGEDCQSCPEDCGPCGPPLPYCGDGECNDGEDCGSCAEDCGPCPPPAAFCGDGICNNGESCATCPRDCQECSYGGSCGDGYCDRMHGETCFSCPVDCSVCDKYLGAVCGNGRCERPVENPRNCPVDCGRVRRWVYDAPSAPPASWSLMTLPMQQFAAGEASFYNASPSPSPSPSPTPDPTSSPDGGAPAPTASPTPSY